MRKSKRDIERKVESVEKESGKDTESIPVRIVRNRVNENGEIVERNAKEIEL